MNSPNMELKRINRNRIFRYIQQQGVTSKAEMSYDLRISLPTLTHNITALRELNLITESGEYESTGGRRAKMISCNARARVAIGVNITRNHISVVVVDLMGNVIDSVREPFDCQNVEKTMKKTMEKIGELINHMLWRNQIDEETALGVGISLPAIIDEDCRTIQTDLVIPFPDDFYDQLKAYISLPYLLYNDANCGGFAELWNRKPFKRDMFYFSLSGTVGGAALLNDRIYLGADATAGEIGHLTLVPNGKQCYCGQKGCVDCYCNCYLLADVTDGDLIKFFDELKKGNPKAKERMEEYLDYLAVAIHNVRMILDCDVILGGYVGSYSELYMDSLLKRLREKEPFGYEGPYVIGCHHHTEAAAVGAALIFVDRFIAQV